MSATAPTSPADPEYGVTLVDGLGPAPLEGTNEQPAAADVPALGLAAAVRRWHAGRIGLAVCLGAAYALGAWPAFWYQSAPGGASAFWPPAGLTLATLLLTPRRTWPVWLAAFAAAEIGVDLAHHEAVSLALGGGLANTAEPLVGALLARRFVRSVAATRANLLGFVACAVVGGPVVGALIGATATVWFPPPGQGWWDVASTWWLGDALGALVVGSVILVWACRPRSHYRVPVATIAAMALLGGGAIVASAVLWKAPVILAALPVLTWAAFAGGSLAVMTVGAAVAAATDWAALTGRTGGLLAAAPPPHDLAVLQCFLGLTLLTAMLLNVEIAERRSKEELARHAEAAAVKVVEAERHSISQETHDIVGHGLTAMLVQLGAARQLLRRDPSQAEELLASAEAIGRGACGELEIALSSLGQAPPTAPGRGLSDLPQLVDMLTAAGFPVTLDMGVSRRALPTLVDWSAYRIAREALTNVVRHAPGAAARVTVQVDNDELVLSIVDHGTRAAPGGAPLDGRGIVGMRERATALGGTLEASPRAGGGFAVVSRLPLTRA
ncbi:MAG TPA: MASE1 domain-containing protein [Acidimicrobiales bacterium]|nr:MASE1 domain-containing protein [Acidimicrobiales bacterium]